MDRTGNKCTRTPVAKQSHAENNKILGAGRGRQPKLHVRSKLLLQSTEVLFCLMFTNKNMPLKFKNVTEDEETTTPSPNKKETNNNNNFATNLNTIWKFYSRKLN